MELVHMYVDGTGAYVCEWNLCLCMRIGQLLMYENRTGAYV